MNITFSNQNCLTRNNSNALTGETGLDSQNIPAHITDVLTNEKYVFCERFKHGLQSLPLSPKRAERKGRRRPFREAGSGHKQWNTVSCVDTFSIISKFSAQNSKI